MTNRQDCKKNVLVPVYGDDVNTAELAWLQANGATSANINQAQYEFLIVNGVIPAHISDMWFDYFRSLGFVGSRADMEKQFWCGDGTVLPAADITLDALVLGLNEGDPVNSMGFLTSANPPTYNLAVQNGLNVIKFDGVGNEMNGALAVTMTKFSYYVVLKYGTHEDNAGMMSVGPSGGNDWDNDNGVVFSVHGGASNNNQIAIRRGNIGNILSAFAPVVPTDFVLLEGHINTEAGTVVVILNGGTAITDTFDSLNPIIPDIFVLGGRVISGAVGAPYSNFSFGEARLYNSLLTEYERSGIRNEMLNKWNL